MFVITACHSERLFVHVQLVEFQFDLKTLFVITTLYYDNNKNKHTKGKKKHFYLSPMKHHFKNKSYCGTWHRNKKEM